MRKALYVAFSGAPRSDFGESLRIEGRLMRSGEILGAASVSTTGEGAGNLVFDLPYELSGGSYSIVMEARTKEGTLAARGVRTYKRSELRSDASERLVARSGALREVPFRAARTEKPHVTDADRVRGYALLAGSPFAYTDQGGAPRAREAVEEIATRTARNATVALSFSVYRLRNIGKIRVGISDMRSRGSIVLSDRIRIACVESVPDTTGTPRGTFRFLPAKLRPIGSGASGHEDCSRFWLTMNVDAELAPGSYSGVVTISPERAAASTLPIRFDVTPITLEDVPGVDYCMLMTYEFLELAMPWTPGDKVKIQRAADRVVEDYRDHGMTTLCLHSPFVWMTTGGGDPVLDDIKAALRSARAAGYSRPIVWYMGHLIQTAKPRHPGNILGFDESIHLARLRDLVRSVTESARKEGYPGVIVLPIDESDDSYQDVNGRRLSITPALVRAIRDAGGISMVTAERYSSLGRPDYLASSRLIPAERNRAHAAGARYWVYENRVATQCTSPTFARFQYGYFTWKHDLDGMSSWTFQNTQNAAGPPGKPNPFGASDGDVYLAYPSPSGPIATIKWEAIRAGIEDHKLVYQLAKRIDRLRSEGKAVREFENFLAKLKTEPDEPCCDASTCPVDEARWLDERREAVMTMTLRAESALR